MENGKGWMGKRVVNEEEFFTQVQRLRSALPKSMKDAEDLMKKAEAVVKSAQGEADRLIDGAEREAERLVSDARTRADRTIAEAKALADRTTAEAKTNAERMTTEAKAHAERTVTEAKTHSERLTEETKNRTDKAIDDANVKAQKTIDEANERAHRIEEDASKRAAEMVSEHEITLRASEEADATRVASITEAETMRQNADDYAFEVLDKVSVVIEKLGMTVTAGKDALRPPAGSYSDSSEYGNEALTGNGAYNGYRG